MTFSLLFWRRIDVILLIERNLIMIIHFIGENHHGFHADRIFSLLITNHFYTIKKNLVVISSKALLNDKIYFLRCYKDHIKIFNVHIFTYRDRRGQFFDYHYFQKTILVVYFCNICNINLLGSLILLSKNSGIQKSDAADIWTFKA